jgi:hypothetical protein
VPRLVDTQNTVMPAVPQVGLWVGRMHDRTPVR